MNPRQIIYLTAILSLTVSFIIVGLIVIYKIDRTILGFPKEVPHNIHSGPDLTKVKVQISKARLNELETGLIEKAKLKEKSDALYAAKRRLLDSIGKIGTSIKFFQDSSSSYLKALSESRQKSSKLYDSLVRMQSQFEKMKKELKVTEEKLKRRDKTGKPVKDSTELENLKVFAKIYNNSSPADVAKILEKIDESDAALILKYMQAKKAGKVIEAMKPEHAASIMQPEYK
jgi:flagellar motility protein MotE (MotC chaperone)